MLQGCPVASAALLRGHERADNDGRPISRIVFDEDRPLDFAYAGRTVCGRIEEDLNRGRFARIDGNIHRRNVAVSGHAVRAFSRVSVTHERFSAHAGSGHLLDDERSSGGIGKGELTAHLAGSHRDRPEIEERLRKLECAQSGAVLERRLVFDRPLTADEQNGEDEDKRSCYKYFVEHKGTTIVKRHPMLSA